MTVPPGYKATEVGVIPEDWEVARLGTRLSQHPSYGINAAAVGYKDQLPRYLRITDITEDGRFSNSSAVSVDHAASDRYFLNQGDLVFARTGASTGKSYRYRGEDGRLVYAGFLIRVAPNPERLNPVYLENQARTQRFSKYIAEVSQRSGQPGINSKQLADFEFAIPPTTTEQSAIAEALSDVDAAIAAVEAVIAKKCALKTATMQAVLSGTRRLPGFSGAWTKTPIGQIGRWVGGATPSMANANYWTNGTIFWASSSDVRNGRLSSTANLITSDAIKNTATREVPENTILLVTRSGILRRFLPVAITTRNIAINQDLKALLVHPAYHPQFFYHAITAVSDEILNSCMKAGTTVESIDLDWLKQFELEVPDDKDEQVAISTALFDLDDELLLLDSKLAKLRLLKTGMMQQLLTGKIRLV